MIARNLQPMIIIGFKNVRFNQYYKIPVPITKLSIKPLGLKGYSVLNKENQVHLFLF